MLQAIKQRLTRVEHEIRLLVAAGSDRRKYPVGGISQGDPTILAWVAEWSVLAESAGVAYRWKYRIEKVAIEADDSVSAVAGDTTFAGWPDVYALNELELQNQPQHIGYQGTGVNQASPYPAGFFLEPLGAGSGGTPALKVIVRARQATRVDGSTLWLIHEVNADNGSCT